MNAIQIGHLLHSSTTQFVAGCSVSQLEAPAFGALVRAPLDQDYSVYGLIYDIHIDDDGLVRQLVTAGNVSPEVMHDNRERRIVPVEMSVLAVGYEQDGKISHLLPPRPPLSLDVIYLCSDVELAKFTGQATPSLAGISATSAISCRPKISRSARCWPPISCRSNKRRKTISGSNRPPRN